MERILEMKEAARRLGVSVRTLQRLHQSKRLRCVFTPRGRRRVPESEVARIMGEMGLAGAVEVSPPPRALGLQKGTGRPAGLSLHEAVEALGPSSLSERSCYLEILTLAAKLGSFTHPQLSAHLGYPQDMASSFCEKLAARGFASKKHGVYELTLKVS